VTVYDRMPSVGRKLLMAGRGGLNLTHSEPLDRFLERYGPARGALASAIEAFGPEALRAWCSDLGQKTFVGSSGRVFPRAMKASPLLRAWLRRLSSSGVAFRPSHRWIGWGGDGALRFETPTGEIEVRPDVTLLALGGASWPRLGSDGGWAAILRARGIEVTPLRPANGGVCCAWSEVFRSRFAGEPLKRIAVSISGVSVRGEAMITDDGLEGGAIYALSREIRAALDRDGVAELAIDLRPDLDGATVQRAMGGSGVSRANAYRRAGLSPAAAGLVRDVGGEPKLAVVRVTALRPIERAISTAGGVALDEINAAFMLQAIPGTFVAGEMLDWEAPTGGYLLQGCFSTGLAAAGEMETFI